MVTLEELKKYNEEEEREDTLYLVYVIRYRKGQSGYIEKGGDPVYAMTNDYDEALTAFESEINYLSDNEYATVELMQAYDICSRNVEYVPIKEFDNRI